VLLGNGFLTAHLPDGGLSVFEILDLVFCDAHDRFPFVYLNGLNHRRSIKPLG
jgi:hypothetical protein